MEINEIRSRIIKKTGHTDGDVVYWMSRDQRIEDNWAFIEAVSIANRLDCGISVIFCLAPEFLEATLRQYDFMLKGLKETAAACKKLSIPFYLLAGNPPAEAVKFVNEQNISILVTDFDPLKIKRAWKEEVIANTACTIVETDAHNIIPAFLVSGKTEYAAYTIRPKIHRLLDEYLIEFPAPQKTLSNKNAPVPEIDWSGLRKQLRVDRTVQPVSGIVPGTKAAREQLSRFLQSKLDRYDEDRNDPNKDALSGLSPYLHFGQISPQRVALQVKKDYKDSPGAAAFLEELIVRRELSDNLCLYNESYDSPNGFHSWAQKTLGEHRRDEREYIYSTQEFEKAETHDHLWNAAQLEMVILGKMHGFMRMYWAKKILEWTANVEEAMNTAIYLNDTYELDGRDPNGYAGIAWAIGGTHDRAWQERPVFGKIRYMNYNGCKRKFDVRKYIDTIESLK